MVLESKRMSFRRHEPDDFEAYCATEADPEVRRFVGGKPRTREDAERKFRDVHLTAGGAWLGLMATIFNRRTGTLDIADCIPILMPLEKRLKARRRLDSLLRELTGGMVLLRRRGLCLFDSDSTNWLSTVSSPRLRWEMLLR